MDKLPEFLFMAIGNACKIFDNITYNVHGDETRTRISIIFNKAENKERQHKTKSTMRRDNKRMNDFIKKKAESKTDENTTRETIKEHFVNKTGSNACLMDADEINLRKGERNINDDKAQNDIAHLCDTKNKIHINEYSKEPQTDNKENTTSLNETEHGTLEDITCNNNNCNSEGDVVMADVKTVLSKVIVKHTKSEPDKLIAQVHGFDAIVVFDMKLNKPYQLEPSDKQYDKFKQNVDDTDFYDIRSNHHRPWYMDSLIDELAQFALDFYFE